MVGRASPDEKPGIFLISTETGDIRRVVPAPPDAGFMGDQQPAFSPDGRALAFVRSWDWEGGSQ
jgi:Tol biopolymer transport system component